jgi:hypothetical protein
MGRLLGSDVAVFVKREKRRAEKNIVDLSSE